MTSSAAKVIPGDGPAIETVTSVASRRPLRAPFRTALRQVTELDVIEVKLTWSDARETSSAVSPAPPITGETVGSVQAAVAGPLGGAVRGVPLAHHEEIFRRLHQAMAGNPTAKCAIDLAVHAALAAGCGGMGALLGGGNGPMRTDVTVSLDGPQAMADAALDRAKEGFDVLKLKLGGDVQADVARVAAVWRAVGPEVTLRLDANQAWTAKEALKVLEGLARLGIPLELVEQPVAAHDLAGMALVRRHTPVPVLADESVFSARDVVRAAEMGAADIVNVKLAKCGGLRAARDVVATAEACGLDVIIGCMLEPPAALAAAAALARCLPGGRAHDLDAVWWAGDGGPLSCRPPWVSTADA